MNKIVQTYIQIYIQLYNNSNASLMCSLIMYAEQLKKPFHFLKNSVVDTPAIDFWLQHVNPLWSVNQALGEVVAKKTIATDTVSLKIKVNRHFDVGHAGQHHPVFIEIDGRRYERSYSLTQLDKHHVQLTAKKVNTGKVSTWLVEQAETGDCIGLGQPYGEMYTPEQSEPIVLLAAGSGITPMYSLLQYWAKHKHLKARPVTLMYWVKTPADAAFKTQFESLAAQYPKFNFKIFFTQAEQPDARLNAADVEAIEQLNQSIVYACGPSGFVTKAEQLFSKALCFKSEAFSISPVLNQSKGFVKITLLQSNTVLNIPKGQSILQSLEQQNIKPTYGCRMGLCNKCVCTKAEGATRNLVNGVENTEPNHQLKICVNSAESDLVINL